MLCHRQRSNQEHRSFRTWRTKAWAKTFNRKLLMIKPGIFAYPYISKNSYYFNFEKWVRECSNSSEIVGHQTSLASLRNDSWQITDMRALDAVQKHIRKTSKQKHTQIWNIDILPLQHQTWHFWLLVPIYQNGNAYSSNRSTRLPVWHCCHLYAFHSCCCW